MAMQSESKQELCAMRDCSEMATNGILCARHSQAVRVSNADKLSFKVTDGGCVGLRGGSIRRFGVTLYESEWLDIIRVVQDGSLERFVESNRSRLAPPKGGK